MGDYAPRGDDVMNINQLRYFISVVENQSFSAAAFDCYISQSSISKHIKALESEFGVRFFERKNSRVEVTPAGHIFYRYAEETLKEYTYLHTLLEEYQNNRQYTISLGTIPILSSYGITNIIAAFSAKYKEDNIYFNVNENSQAEILKRLRCKSISLALIRTHYLDDLEQYEVKPFGTDTFVATCHRDHPLAKEREPVSLLTISKFNLYLIDINSNLYRIPMEAFKQAGVKPKLSGTTTRHKILLEMLNNKTAVSILPERLVDKRLFPHLITMRLEEKITSEIALVKLKDYKLNKVSREFWDFWTKENLLANLKNIPGSASFLT